MTQQKSMSPWVGREQARPEVSDDGIGGVPGTRRRLVVSERTVESHTRAVLAKLGLHDDGTTHRRVLAVVKYLESR